MAYTLPDNLTDSEYQAFLDAATATIPEEWGSTELVGAYLPPEFAATIEIDEDVAATMPPVVGLQGKPGSGKDTVAWIAAFGLAAAGVRARVIGTSDPVIIEANEYLLPFGREVGHGNKSWQPYRRLLQTIGEVRRRGNPSYWNEPHRKNIARIQQNELAAGNGLPVIFITGLRTPSDFDIVTGRPLACPVVRVYRDGNPYKADHWIERQLDHLPDSSFAAVIRNSEHDMDGLREQVRRMCVVLSAPYKLTT